VLDLVGSKTKNGGTSWAFLRDDRLNGLTTGVVSPLIDRGKGNTPRHPPRFDGNVKWTLMLL